MAGAGKKTFTAGETLTASDVNSYLMEQSVMVFGGTAARSSAIPTPTEGMFAVTTNDDELDYYNGSAWVPALQIGPWTTYTPTVTATSGAFTTLVTNASFCQIGKTVHLAISIGITTAGTASGGINVTLPVTAKTGSIAVGSGRENSATGNQLQVFIAGATGSCQIWQYNNVTIIASGRTVLVSLTYEAA
jgi:hypothetical protein